jgi:hypothetical protein
MARLMPTLINPVKILRQSNNFLIRFLGEFINRNLKCLLWAIHPHSSSGVRLALNPLFIPLSRPIVGQIRLRLALLWTSVHFGNT